MDNQLVPYRVDLSKAKPPNLNLVFTPFMDPLTEEYIRHAQWETERISEFLAAQPDPLEPDNQTTEDEVRRGLAQYQLRLRAAFAASSRIELLDSEEKGNLACIVAESVYKSKVLSCRILRINALPTEILSLILEIAAKASSTNLIRARLSLSRVCRRWRSVVINNQYLWSVINISPSESERTLEFLERAGPAPLQIRIADSVAAPFTRQTMEQLMNVIVPKVGQLAHLVVVVNSWEAVLVLLDRLYQAPQSPVVLQRLELHRVSGSYFNPNESLPWEGLEHIFQLFKGRLPSLRIFMLNGVHCSWPATHIYDLRLLDVRRVPSSFALKFDELRNILRTSPALHTLHLYALEESSFSPSGSASLEQFTLAHLRSLTFGELTPAQAICVIRSVDAPGLIELNIRCRPDLARYHAPVFSNLIGKFPNLRILHLSNFNATPSPFNTADSIMKRWLVSLSRVEVIHLSNIAPRFLTFFVADGRWYTGDVTPQTALEQSAIEDASPFPQWVLPRLSCIVADSVNAEALIGLLIQRIQIGHPVKRVYVPRRWYSGELLTDHQRRILSGHTELRQYESLTRGTREEAAIWREVNAQRE